MSWVVMKFGGTSVASPSGWQSILDAATSARDGEHDVLVVCSALSGVSNALEDLISAAVEQEPIGEGLEALRQQHRALANELGIELPPEIPQILRDLSEHLQGIRLLREASPRVQARILSAGELMSTRLGVAWLHTQGVDAVWSDARELLSASPVKRLGGDGARYLSATIDTRSEDNRAIDLPAASIVVTQGFIASDSDGETVLLGRGGSDTSAAYFGVLLDADRVEIWTDVPGLFTANPTRVESARHLEELAYDEVAAMASLGARVLHPRCVGPVCDAGVPLYVKSTYLPEARGTAVHESLGSVGVKAVTHRTNLALIELSRPTAWQPVGFVADVSACFKQLGLSIDLMSTSPSTIAVTIDPSSAPGARIDTLLSELERVAEVELTRPVASVSLVGTGVREAFHIFGRAFRELHGVPIRMVSQGAADHHLTFVVDQDLAHPLVKQLHTALFERENVTAGPTLAAFQEQSA